MELPKKKPFGIQLKSTRRSETRDLPHVTPAEARTHPAARGVAGTKPSKQAGVRTAHGAVAAPCERSDKKTRLLATEHPRTSVLGFAVT